MVSLRSILTGSILAIGALSASLEKRAVNPGAVKGDTFIHDPTVVKKPDGTYLAAFTANGVGLKTSTDRTTWKDVGAAFPNGAAWTTTYTKGDKNLWAPDLSYHNGQYYMYYSASSFGTSRSAIFLATSKTGASGSWTDLGRVIESYANRFGYGVVRDFTGHGIGRTFHSGLVVLHYDAPHVPTVIEEGMTFTIEPMITLGGIEHDLWDDGWTVTTRDKSWTAQFEHTIVVTADGAEILTVC